MKTKYQVLWLTVLLVFLLTGCGQNVTLYQQAQQQYNKGQYEASFASVVQSLQLKPGYVKSQVLINEVYPKMIAEREAKIQRLKDASHGTKYDDLVAEYSTIMQLQDTARKLPPLSDPKTGTKVTFVFKDYQEDLDGAKNNAAEYHYERATNLKKSSTDINTQKAAAKEYAAAMSFISNYKNSKMHYEECRKLAIKRIAIIPFEDKTSTHKYGALGDMLVDGIISGIMNDRAATEFLEIITRDQMTALLSEQQLSASGLVDESSASRVGVLLGAHEILTGRLTQVSYIPTNETTKTLDETKNLKVGERSYTDDKGKKKTEAVYDDVTCYYKVHEKTTSVEIRGSYTIVDVSTGKIVSQSSISASYPWKETWGEVIGGDPRALSKDATALCNKPEPFPPHETQLVNNALNNLASQFVQTFKNYVQ